jgi:hypothetical protein
MSAIRQPRNANFCQQRLDAVPSDPHTDAQHDERREPHHHHHARVPDPFADPLGVAIRQQNGQRDDAGTDDGGEKLNHRVFERVRVIGADGDRDRNNPGINRHRQRQGGKGPPQRDELGVDRVQYHIGRFGDVGQEFPAQRAHHGTARHLHHRYRKAEQKQDERAKQQRSQHQEERVERNAFRQKGAGGFIAAGRHSQENRGVAQRINHGQQSADDQQDCTDKLGNVGPDHRVAFTFRIFPDARRTHSAWPYGVNTPLFAAVKSDSVFMARK